MSLFISDFNNSFTIFASLGKLSSSPPSAISHPLRSHICPNSNAGNQNVQVCETYSSTIETTGRGEDEKKVLERHENSGQREEEEETDLLRPEVSASVNILKHHRT
ncbi:CheY-like two-component responsive regulatorfamily protein [Striga asiatica]|uniref:CheY-like two-component responsive regulatorfamily protein n=1 Tax=Striga asiatica TaxID=4170 RepID=A0A5A7PQW3_STRAF|nr:CheY-like two-component responsive regulatorfamily protein [Striga asiatica]